MVNGLRFWKKDNGWTCGDWIWFWKKDNSISYVY